MKKYILLGLLACLLFSCQKDEIEVYESGRLIFISDSAGMDTTRISFKHHLGMNTYDVPFVVHMIGLASDADLTYKIEVVDSLTTALPGEYILPAPPVFAANRLRDTLWITLNKTDRLAAETVRLTIRLVANENFGLGYSDRLTASLAFNDQMSRPDWWNTNITQNFLGTYSDEKYMAFYICTGLDDLTGYAAWEIRLLCLDFREYIKEHNLTEKDGSPMTVVAY